MTPPAESDRPAAPPDARDDLLCPECGYDVRAAVGERCPECGLSLDVLRRHVPMIPWDRSPSPWSYVATVVQVLRSPKRFSWAVFGPMSYRAAQGFRAVTFLLVLAGIGSLLAVNAWVAQWGAPMKELTDQVGGVPVAVVAGCWILTAFLATGVASYFYAPRDVAIRRQNRAIALTYYALAVFAPLALASALAALGTWLLQPRRPWIVDALWLSLAALSFVPAAHYLYVLARFARYVLPGTNMLWRLRLWLPLATLAVILAAGVILPLVLLFFGVVWLSLSGA